MNKDKLTKSPIEWADLTKEDRERLEREGKK